MEKFLYLIGTGFWKARFICDLWRIFISQIDQSSIIKRRHLQDKSWSFPESVVQQTCAGTGVED